MISAGDNIFVTAIGKQVIETLEPQAHQFFPVRFVYAKGEAGTDGYFVVNTLHVLDGLDYEQSDPRVIRPSPLPEVPASWAYRPGQCVFRKSIVGGHHLWRERGFLNRLFCSGILVEAFRNSKIWGPKPEGPSSVNLSS